MCLCACKEVSQNGDLLQSEEPVCTLPQVFPVRPSHSQSHMECTLRKDNPIQQEQVVLYDLAVEGLMMTPLFE